VIVGGSYVDVFLPRIKNNEARMMMLSFAQRETIHMRSYALLNDTLGFPEAEYTAFLEYEAMAKKIEFMQTFDADTKQGLAKAIAQTVCNEGMSLFSAFVMLLNFQRFGKLKGMCEIVEWSIRDETMHVAGMTELFREYINENPEVVTDDFKQSIYEMYRNAVQLEDSVIDLAFEMGGVEGISSGEVKEYIRYIADRRLTNLGLKPNWNIEENPLPWLDWVLNGDSFKNFFEGRVTDYSAAGMSGNSWGW
jgi:glutaredoxin 3